MASGRKKSSGEKRRVHKVLQVIQVVLLAVLVRKALLVQLAHKVLLV